jgi:zinc/manganese transport system substrate-binding protein
MRLPVLFLALAAALGACGGDDADSASGDRPRVVVTTNILGDVVKQLTGDAVEVVTIMPVGSNPHDFQPSPREVDDIRRADLVVVNGGGFEEGLLRVIEGAEADGAVVYEAISAVPVLDREEDAHGHEEEDEDEVAEEAHGHDDGADPHFFTDPARMAVAAEGIFEAIVEQVPELADDRELNERAEQVIGELTALDREVEEMLAAIPAERRVLVTNHEVFGYFADRYGFELVGTVIPGGSTEGAAARDLSVLIEDIERAQVPAIFADTSAPADLARALAADVGDVEVVELFSESLGEEGSGAETYVEMMRTNARRIVEALA